MRLRFICLLALLQLGLFATSSVADTLEKTIVASNKMLQYTGRIDFSDANAPFLSWPASSVKARFTGSSLAVILDDQKGENYFNVIINGNTDYPFVIDCEPGEQTYVVSTSLHNDPHTVEIFKRTEGQEGGTRFKGFVLDADARLLQPPERPMRRIEFYGDSVTSGMGNEAADNASDYLASDKNNYLAYGSFVARNLNAEHHSISQSSIGIMISWIDFIMPEFYNQLSAVGNNDTEWNFSVWTPDVVVINLMQNDSWLIDLEKRLQPMPTEQARIQAYMDFLSLIRNQYPHALIICVLGSMDATRQGSLWPGYISQAVERIKQQDPSEKIETLFFDFTGYEPHPRVHQHKLNADKLTAFIKQKMQW